ncbi:MAG TPA: acetate/propionate family kinase [Thermoanaerobaculia bacterium]
MTARGTRTVLSLNGGSSSLKFAAFSVGVGDGEPQELVRGAVERIGSPGAVLRVGGAGTRHREERCDAGDLGAAVPRVLDALTGLGIRLDAAGHRIVHGGRKHLQPARVGDALIASLREAIPFAPLHLPGELALIEAVGREHAALPQVACFDTAFHARMPEIAQRLPLPSSLWDSGVHRYGFHGLSYESIVRTLGPLVSGRVIVAHLGNGASMVALSDGQPLETTMGLTPSAGLVMGTRPGDLDPGVVVYLARNRAMDASALEDLITRQSGLLALSESSGDMQSLLAARASDHRAELAVAIFCYSARKWIGALSAVLGGLDTLVFTGGIGEHAAPVREEICRGLGYLGIDLDLRRNARSESIVTAEGSQCTVRVIATDEERVVARHTAQLTGGPSP